MASTPVITSPTDNSQQTVPFDVVGTSDGVLVEARDDAGLLLPATENPVPVVGNAWTIHVTGLQGNRGGAYATMSGQVSLPASGPTIASNGDFGTPNSAASATHTSGTVSWEAGDVIVVGIIIFDENPVVSTCTVGGVAAELRARLRMWNTTIAHIPSYGYIYKPASAGSGVIEVTLDQAQRATCTYWIVRGSASGTVLPATVVAAGSVDVRASTTTNAGPSVTQASVTLSQAAGTRPAANSLIIGIQGTFIPPLGTANGASRTMLSGMTRDSDVAPSASGPGRATMFHVTALADGSSDVVAGSTDSTAVYANTLILEIQA